MLPSILQDTRYALRASRSNRSGLLISLIVLSVAIAAATTTFSVVSGVLLRSLPYEDADRLMNVRVVPVEFRTDWGGATMSQTSIDLILSEEGIFESTASMYGNGRPTLTGLGEPERVDAWTVDSNFFEVLGSPAMIGRTLQAEDATWGGGLPVVVSHRFWSSRLGGSADAVGRQLTIGDRAHEVVGVMPPGFDFPEGAQIWQVSGPPTTPVEATASPQGRNWLVGRLNPGVVREQALERLDARFLAFATDETAFARWSANLAPLEEILVGPVRRPLQLLMIAVVLVMLVACANVASVLVARGVARRREFAIRLSIGATRVRIARQLLTESVLLALASGAAGVALAYWTLPLAISVVGDHLPRIDEIAIDWRVLGAAVLGSAATGILAGVLPAVLTAREDVTGALKDGAVGSGTSSWRTRTGEILVVLQICVGTLLMTGAVLLSLSLLNLLRTDLGFDADRVVVARLSLPSGRYPSAQHRQAFADALRQRAQAMPDVTAAAWSSGIPMDGGMIGPIETPGRTQPEGIAPAWITFAGPEYFRALGMTLVRGRGLETMAESTAREVVVNQTFARTYFPGLDPLGRAVVYPSDVRAEIVGIVSDVNQGSIRDGAEPQIYAPTNSGTHLSVRTSGAPDATIAMLRDAIRELDPELPIDRLRVLEGLLTDSVARERFYTVLLNGFALISLLITVLGTYGLVSYTVSRRNREIGIRLALGAGVHHVQRVLLGRTALLSFFGIALGLAGASAATRVLQSYLYGITARDPLSFALVGVIIVGVVLLAAYGPARRATRIDPAVVLRAE